MVGPCALLDELETLVQIALDGGIPQLADGIRAVSRSRIVYSGALLQRLRGSSARHT